MAWFRRRKPPVPPVVLKNISSLNEVEQELARQRSPLDRISDTITSFTGSVRFIIAHLIFFAVWVVLNVQWLLGEHAFDPYPYVFLNFVLAAEAVLLGTFVLMSQNRQNRQSDLWLHVVLQLSMLSEQETTKTLQLLQRICERLGIADAARDKELKQLVETTQIETLAKELEQARQEQTAEAGGEHSDKKEGAQDTTSGTRWSREPASSTVAEGPTGQPQPSPTSSLPRSTGKEE